MGIRALVISTGLWSLSGPVGNGTPNFRRRQNLTIPPMVTFLGIVGTVPTANRPFRAEWLGNNHGVVHNQHFLNNNVVHIQHFFIFAEK